MLAVNLGASLPSVYSPGAFDSLVEVGTASDKYGLPIVDEFLLVGLPDSFSSSPKEELAGPQNTMVEARAALCESTLVVESKVSAESPAICSVPRGFDDFTMVIETALDIVLAPRLSVALAVSVCVPFAALSHTAEYGLETEVPIKIPSR